jgi:hypothetical protein
MKGIDMKKIRLVISLSFLVLFLLVVLLQSICFSEQPNPKVWEYLRSNVYYNKTNLTKSSNIISVWIYQTVTDDGRKLRREIEKKIDLENSKKYENYDHDIGLWNIDCKKRLYRNKKYVEYDDKGNVLYSDIDQNSKWDSIKPNNVWETLYDKVCVTPKKPLKKK